MFVIEVPYFNLSQIYDSRQCPRWKKINNNKFVIVNDKKAVKVDQIKDKLIFNCSQEEFYEQWYNYLDLGRDYDKLNYSIKSRNGKFSFLADKGYGIHILNQNKFESFVYAGIVNMYGFKKAKKAIHHIVKYCGVYHESSMGNAGPAVWYEFPTPKMILDNFQSLKNGKSKQMVISNFVISFVAQKIIEKEDLTLRLKQNVNVMIFLKLYFIKMNLLLMM